LSPLAITHGEPADALDYAMLSLRYYYDSGNVYLVRNPLAILAVLFDRLGHHEPASVTCGFAVTPFTQSVLPEISETVTRLREALGDEAYESFSRTGEHMSAAEMVAYTLDQITQARFLLAANGRS